MTVDTPGWVRDAVFYQVFPDRFAASRRVAKPGPLEPWTAPPTNHGYKGGDLLGVVERLDELVDLGISALYLNPVFQAASNHRYNAFDYFAVDPLLGGDAALRELITAAHARRLRVILDGVFNHVGRGFWPFHHVLESGADSPYRDWFYLSEDVLAGRSGVHAYAVPRGGPTVERDGPATERGYRSWWDVPSLPKLRVENPAVREMLMSVAEHWIRFGADGWRLDVPQDIEDETFWPEFRRRVRGVNPEAYLLGEIWDEGPDWLRGDRFDALMNYPLAIAILGFVGGPAIDPDVIAGQSNYARAVRGLDGPEFGTAVERQLALYDPAVTAVQYNLIGSHDTPRARSVMGGAVERLRLATLLQMVLPGAPAIYYGDEIGMEGAADPDCRRAYPEAGTPLPPEAVATRRFVAAVIAARRRHAALRTGEVSVLAAGPRWIVIGRRSGEGHAVVAVNAGETPVVVSAGGLNALRSIDLPWASVAAGEVTDGGDALRLPGLSGIVLAND